ncbi:MAG TPA: hypothetical protein VGH33_16720 [Isosphaeraceae bacterium]|jgi:hypothetical protein
MAIEKQPEGTSGQGFRHFLPQLIRDYAVLIVIAETIVIILLVLRLFRVI